jgi:hypothetical protein
MDYLASGMDSGIGATGNDCFAINSGDFLKRALNFTLNSAAIWLFTPAKEICPIVGNI